MPVIIRQDSTPADKSKDTQSLTYIGLGISIAATLFSVILFVFCFMRMRKMRKEVKEQEARAGQNFVDNLRAYGVGRQMDIEMKDVAVKEMKSGQPAPQQGVTK